MSPKSSHDFGGLTVTVSPAFVRNIECSVVGGKLVSIVPADQQGPMLQNSFSAENFSD
jgi:hypothetical protein